MPIDLYHTPGSAPCQSVRLVAAAIGVELDLKPINLMAGDHLKLEFLKINPQHTIPTLDDCGFYLWESRAICVYLIEKYAKDDLLYPKCPKTRAVINQRLYFDMGSLYENFGQDIYPQLKQKLPADPAKLEKCYGAMAVLENFLEANEYVVGNHLTVADLVLIPSVVCYTNVERWMKKISGEAPEYNKIVGEGHKGFKAWIDAVLKK